MNLEKLDSIDEVKKLDSNYIYESIVLIPDQFKQSWYEVKDLEINEKYENINNVVVSGMGGSALGGRVIDSLISDRIRVPVEVFTEYKLPNYVNEKSLIILSSYSGNTEETVTDLHQAVERNAKIFVISTGGKIGDYAKDKDLPFYKLNPIHNPSGQPRMGLGYSIASILSFLTRYEFVPFAQDEIDYCIDFLAQMCELNALENEFMQNPAKKIAQELFNRIPILIASEHIVGAAHSFKNQLNETAKTFSNLFDVPELNHHLMEGLANPKKAKELLKFLFLESDLYSPNVIKRYPITQEVVEKNAIDFIKYRLLGKKKIEQTLEALLLGIFSSYYLAILYDQDPSVIPWVDYFKKELAKN